ncbi:MAG: MBL fold metallo-hydrolase [Acidobacteria bacterium]|nr:MBL fold metallo-hydrolase [Acidobacteriota bacterium]
MLSFGVLQARVTILGSGTSHGVPMIGCTCEVCQSPDPHDRRLRPSIYLEVDGGPSVLVDTSTDLRQQALTHGVRRVDAILITHSHADHVLGMDEVRRFNILNGGAIPLYASAATGRELRRIFQYVFEPPSQKGGGIPQVVLREIDGPFAVGALHVQPVPLLHGTWPILGFRFGRFAYLTDASTIPDEAWPLLEGLDVLILNALRHRPHPTHFSLSEAVAVTERLAPARAFFTHVCHDLPHAATNRSLPAGMALASDGLSFAVEVG